MKSNDRFFSHASAYVGLLVTSEKKATEELRGVPVYATMWPKNISSDVTSAMANGLNSYKS